jgi:hypothetical protein
LPLEEFGGREKHTWHLLQTTKLMLVTVLSDVCHYSFGVLVLIHILIIQQGDRHVSIHLTTRAQLVPVQVNGWFETA